MPNENSRGRIGSPEGDLNTSGLRRAFLDGHIDEAAKALLDEDARYFLHQSLSTPCLNVLSEVDGTHLLDSQGRRILDFHGNSAHQVGYAHPRVVEAVKDQLDRLAFCPRRYTNAPAIELAKRLSSISPIRQTAEPARVLLAPGGTSAIGIALKLARLATGRFKTVSMWDSFHGASLDAISIGGESLFRQGMGPLLPGCLHVPPYDQEGLGRDSAAYIEYVLEKEPDIAAVVAEPMRWTTVIAPPAEYWQTIRAACDRHGALLIIDEIPSCLGRTGKMFCMEHFGVQPDIVVLGKGLGGGVFPLAAVVARSDLNIATDGALGHYTHEKSPLGAAAAIATLDVIEEEQLLDRAAHLGRVAKDRLNSLCRDEPSVREVRGLGLHLAIELQGGDGLADQVLYMCLEKGLSFKTTGGNVLVLSPPLTINEEDFTEAIDIVIAAIRGIHDS